MFDFERFFISFYGLCLGEKSAVTTNSVQVHHLPSAALSSKGIKLRTSLCVWAALSAENSSGWPCTTSALLYIGNICMWRAGQGGHRGDGAHRLFWGTEWCGLKCWAWSSALRWVLALRCGAAASCGPQGAAVPMGQAVPQGVQSWERPSDFSLISVQTSLWVWTLIQLIFFFMNSNQEWHRTPRAAFRTVPGVGGLCVEGGLRWSRCHPDGSIVVIPGKTEMAEEWFQSRRLQLWINDVLFCCNCESFFFSCVPWCEAVCDTRVTCTGGVISGFCSEEQIEESFYNHWRWRCQGFSKGAGVFLRELQKRTENRTCKWGRSRDLWVGRWGWQAFKARNPLPAVCVWAAWRTS